MRKVEILRKKYPQFFYRGYSYELKKGDLPISFHFEIPPDIAFHPTVLIKNVSRGILARVGERTLRNLVFNLGMMEIPSYWKATCSPEIVVEAGHLDKAQLAWWHDLILKGMGEFFYQNKIDFTKPGFLRLTCSTSGVEQVCSTPDVEQKAMVPVGGGKDAALTLELLKKAKIPVQGFVLNPKKEHLAILALAGQKNPIVAERAIDSTLLELNRKGYLNGHTPFSAYVAFVSVLAAALFNCRYIALSNERSSNEGNVKYLGRVINHQYSKSFAFEKRFREYTKKYLAKSIEYFSFLRPLYELQIAGIFSRYPKYFPVFLSCNEARKTSSGRRKQRGRWCGKCAKCLFVYAVLRLFVPEHQLLNIFKRNLLQDARLEPFKKQLMGERGFKPFECVGTIKESRVVFGLAPLKPMLKAWNRAHFLSFPFVRILKHALQTIPYPGREQKSPEPRVDSGPETFSIRKDQV